MKILFSQAMLSENQAISVMDKFGIAGCYLKFLLFGNDYKNTTLKMHHHTNYEIHIIFKGSQTYEISGESITVDQGEFILISPLVKHKVSETKPDTEKISLTFSTTKDKPMDLSLKNMKDYIFGETPEDVCKNISYIKQENKTKGEYYYHLVSGRVFECIIHILRCGGLEDVMGIREGDKEDARLSIAKQYIKDNIEKNISVQDIANYCNLSVKQITRIFKEKETVGVAEYIRQEKAEYIVKLLFDKEMTLKQISEKMNFNNEYYFNTFVKKNLGMTPGEYRKTITKN